MPEPGLGAQILIELERAFPGKLGRKGDANSLKVTGYRRANIWQVRQQQHLFAHNPARIHEVACLVLSKIYGSRSFRLRHNSAIRTHQVLAGKGDIRPQRNPNTYEEATNDILKQENGSEGVAAMETIRAQIVRAPATRRAPTRRTQ